MAASFLQQGYKFRRGYLDCGVCGLKLESKKVLCQDCNFAVGPCCMEANSTCWLCNLEHRAEKAPPLPAAPKSRFVVLGGSMVGSYFAFAMAKRGFQVDVYDKNKDIGTWEGIINLNYTTLKVLEVDGALDEIVKEHIKATTAVFCGKNADTIVGEVDIRKDAAKYNLPQYMLTCNRLTFQAQIQDLARKAGARFHTEKEATAIEQTEGPGGGVKVTFKDGTIAEGDFLIGADGNRSFVRNTMFKEEGGTVEPTSTLHWCANGVIRGFDGYGDMVKNRDQTEFWGPNGVLGFFPYKDDKMFMFMLQKGNRPPHPKDIDRAAYQRKVVEIFKKDFSGYDSWVGPMFEKLDPSTVGAFELPEVGKALTTWNKGRVLLLGDAAHAMCNRLGSGGCTGMEDSHNAAELIEFCTRTMGDGDEAVGIKEAFALTTRRRRLRGLLVAAKSMEVAQVTVLLADSCFAPCIRCLFAGQLKTPEEKKDGSMDFIANFRCCSAHRVQKDGASVAGLAV